MENMSKLESHALEVLHEAFCRVRYLSKHPLNEAGRNHLFLVADAAHNIPSALAGDEYHREFLERDVAYLEALMSEPYGVAVSKYLDTTPPRKSFMKRIRLALSKVV